MILLIRHGESKANIKGIYQGQSFNLGLSSRGKKQSEALANALTEYKPNRIFSSPLQRTMQTAKIIAKKLKKKVQTDNLLQEMNHGTWEGKYQKDFNHQELELLQLWKEKPHKTQMIKSEHFNDIANRCQQIINKFTKLDGTTVIVTHDTVSRILASLLLNLPLGKMWNLHLDNCGITKIGSNPPRIISLNETHHLNGLKSDIGKQAL